MRSSFGWVFVGLSILSCASGCDWPPKRYSGGPGAGPGSSAAGSDAGGGSNAVSEGSLLLPADGAPNADGTVTGTVLDAHGNRIGQVDFFTSQGAPSTDADGNTIVPDALIGVSGVEDITDPSSRVASNEIDVAADELVPGATFTVQAGALTFAFTVEQANVESVGGEHGVEVSSLVVDVDVWADDPNASETNGGTGDPGNEACTPNAEQSCSCPDGAQSIEQCASDGTWGACQCSGW